MRSTFIALSLTLAAAAPAHAGIQQLGGLEAVKVWEQTAALSIASFAPGDTKLTSVLSGAALTASTRDFGYFAGDENYDLYYSDADGSFNANGSYLTIDGNCNVALTCFNINEVALRVNGVDQFATSVVRTVYGRPGSFVANSGPLAADGNLSTFTALGDTIGLGADARMSITLSFANIPAVPEPGALLMLSAGLAVVAGVASRRRA